MVLPSSLSCTLLGSVGAVVSGAVMVAAGETLPAASVAVTVRVWPLACAAGSVTLKVPSLPTVALANVLPLASLIATVDPASPLPEMVLPSSLSCTLLGSVGAVVSGAVIVAAVEVLPAASVAVTVRVWPLVCAAGSVTLKLPSLPTVALANVLPSASLIATVDPASPLPVTVSPSSLSCTPLGSAGAVVSGAVMVAAGEILPAASVAVTLKVCPLVCAAGSVTLKVPSLPTVALANVLPSASLTATVDPASALPETVRPLSLITISLGAAGAVVSFVSLSAPLLPVAVVSPPAPLSESLLSECPWWDDPNSMAPIPSRAAPAIAQAPICSLATASDPTSAKESTDVYFAASVPGFSSHHKAPSCGSSSTKSLC